MTKIDLHTHVHAAVDPVWEVVTRFDEKGLGGLGIHALETSSGNPWIEDGLRAKLRLAMKVSRFMVGGIITVRIEDFDEERCHFGVNVLEAPDGIRGKVNLSLAESDGNPKEMTHLRFGGELRLPFKASLGYSIARPLLDGQVMPHVGETLAAKARLLSD